MSGERCYLIHSSDSDKAPSSVIIVIMLFKHLSDSTYMS